MNQLSLLSWAHQLSDSISLFSHVQFLLIQIFFLSICSTIFFHTSFLTCSSCKKSEIEILSVNSEISWQSSESSFIHAWTICWKIESICAVLTYLNTVCVNSVTLVLVFTSFIENVRCCSLSTAFKILDLNCLTSVEIHSFSRNSACMIFFSMFKSSIVCQLNAVSHRQTCRLFLIIVSSLSAATSQTWSVKM